MAELKKADFQWNVGQKISSKYPIFTGFLAYIIREGNDISNIHSML